MKKHNKAGSAPSKQVPTLGQAALAGVSAGGNPHAGTLVEPYIGQQHNETIIRDRRPGAQRGAGRRRRGARVAR